MRRIPLNALNAPNVFNVGYLRQVCGALVLLLLSASLLRAQAPAWWSTYGVINTAATADDYTVANQGQAKNIASKARAYLNDNLPGGAEVTLNNLVNGWATPLGTTEDYAVLNLGQLKSLSALFYDRLNAATCEIPYPWTVSTTDDDDYSVVNLGQLKNAFKFALLPVPSGLTATPGNAQVALNWNAVAGATSYKIKRSTTSGTGYVDFIGNTTASPTIALTNTGLTNGTAYYYVVLAKNTTSSSVNSAQVAATPVAPPTAPASLTATPGNAQVTLNWTAATGAATYKVQRSTTNGSGYVDFPGNTTTAPTVTLTNTGLTNGTTYYYVVTATNTGGSSANSAQAAATPVSPPGPDNDNDGLPDEWELFYFGNLNQTGMTDFDGDGKTNLEEFFAGTNPTVSNLDPNDHTPPVITLTKPPGAVLIP